MSEQYRPSRRAWVKLWTNEWLTGTIRWQLTPAERSTWADLLCLSGMSRFPGIVASGYESDENSPLMGYPLSWLASQCGNLTEKEMLATLQKLKAQDRIEVEEGNGFFLVRIKSWAKYQSEYMLKRQRRKYTEPQRADGDYNVHTKSAKCPPEEVEVEVEVDKKEAPMRAKSARTLARFEEFWKRYPRKSDRKRAFTAWRNLSEANQDLAIKNLDGWIQCRQWREDGGRYVPYAQKWLNRELFKDDPRATAAPDDFNERFDRVIKK
jgi:hypothetical protein